MRLQNECHNIDQLSTRNKAIVVATFLRTHNLTGLATELAYRDLQNNYIGIALQNEEHPSLPLISAAIFCAIANRVGIDARCCGMPAYVYAMVYPKPNETLDSRELREGQTPSDPMYLDPWQSDKEVPVEHLQHLLGAFGVPPANFSQFLADSSVGSLVIRTSQNIIATVKDFRGFHGGNSDNTGHPTIRLHANPYVDMENAFYSALWANYLLSSSVPRSSANSRNQFIPLILERLERLYPMDASLIEKYICPAVSLAPSPIVPNWELNELLRIVRAADSRPKQLRLRDPSSAQDKVKYTVGQVFRHRRYGYTAVITGWDIECGMDSDWIVHNQVDSLARGRHQSFYHAL